MGSDRGREDAATAWLARWSAGDTDSGRQAIALVYGELRAIAHRLFRGERVDHTLQPTALVHKIFLQLETDGFTCRDRGHFLALAARKMRWALVDHARRRRREKRGGARARVPMSTAEAEASLRSERLIALDDALRDLAARAPRMARVVELRYFAGLSVRQVATCLDVSPRTVDRDWCLARAFLLRALDEPAAPPRHDAN